MAAPSPMGMDTASAMAVVHSVPVMRGSTPYAWSLKRGVHEVPVRNSTMLTSRKNWIAGRTRESTMPTVVRIDTPAAATRQAYASFSARRGREERRDTGGCRDARRPLEVVEGPAPALMVVKGEVLLWSVLPPQPSAVSSSCAVFFCSSLRGMYLAASATLASFST